MTFFTLLGKTFSSLILAWVRDKTNLSKTFIFRVIVFAFAIMSIAVPAPIWYYKAYLPYEGYIYPQLLEMNVSSGIWIFSHDSKKLNYVLTSNGRKILFNLHGDIGKYRNDIMKLQGLNPLSKLDPEIHVKVWWFQRPNTEKNAIGQLEIEGKMISSYEEEYKAFIKHKNHDKFFAYLEIIMTLIMSILIWEFIVQYIKYRQENK